MLESELIVKLVAALPPKLTAVAPVKPDPEMVTAWPPVRKPCDWETDVTVGFGTHVYLSAALTALWPGLRTVTSTVPVPGGATAASVVSETTLKEAAEVEPKLTAVAPSKFVPVIVTVVPPAAGPDGGLSPVTVGQRWGERGSDIDHRGESGRPVVGARLAGRGRRRVEHEPGDLVARRRRAEAEVAHGAGGRGEPERVSGLDLAELMPMGTVTSAISM
jgi:hypothetical protein